MIAGQIVPSNFLQSSFYNTDLSQALLDGKNPFRLPKQSTVKPNVVSKPQQSGGTVLAQLNQAIAPTQDPSSLDIGMSSTLPPTNSSDANNQANSPTQQTQGSDATNTKLDGQNKLTQVLADTQNQEKLSQDQNSALKQRDDASKQQADASNQISQAVQQTQALPTGASADSSPGKALSDSVRQTQMEVNSTASESSQAGGAVQDKLSAASNALDLTDGVASRADKGFRDATTQQTSGIIQNLLGTGMSNLGQGLQGMGDTLTDKGGSLIEVGQVLAAIPFTMPIGLALIAAGKGLQATGKGMKASGKSMDTTGIFMQKDAKQMDQNSKRLFQTSATQIAHGEATIEATHNTLQNIRSDNNKKQLRNPKDPGQTNGSAPKNNNQFLNSLSQQPSGLTPNSFFGGGQSVAAAPLRTAR